MITVLVVGPAQRHAPTVAVSNSGRQNQKQKRWLTVCLFVCLFVHWLILHKLRAKSLFRSSFLFQLKLTIEVAPRESLIGDALTRELSLLITGKVR